jgi:hypothetical protein
MRIIDISKFEDMVILHFDAEGMRINAYTLASTLVSIADAAKAANNSINLGYDIEIVVEAVGPGSFRAKIRAIYTASKNLFSCEAATAVILGVVGNYIYERAFAVDDSVKIEIHTDEVVIERREERIVVPRIVYDATRRVEKNPSFVRAVNKIFEAVAADESIKSIGLVPELDSPPPEVVVTRHAIQSMNLDNPPDPATRPVEEQCELQIVKAILERGRRKWEFMWRGVRISAPILHEDFYADFFAHSITIAPGDTLKVRLLIKQVLDEKTGIYTNDGYEVIHVYEHVPRLKQMHLNEQPK